MALTKTKVLSTRVTPDVFDAIHRMAKTNKMSVSDYLGNVATSRLPAMPVNAVDNVEVPVDLTNTLTVFGGGAVLGTITYKILKAYLPKDRYTKAQIDMYSFVGAFSVGILGAIGISKLMKTLSKA